MDFATVAHDSRTPLHAMLGHSQLLGIEGLSDGARRRVAIIEARIHRISRAIDRCLAQSDFPAPVTVVYLNAAIASVIAELGVLLRQRRVRVVVSDEPLPPPAGDRDLLHRVLVNVMINASEAMPASGQTVIRTSHRFTAR